MSERDIFLAVLDIADPAERARHLDGACGGDMALRERVEALIRSHDGAGSFLASPAVAVPQQGQAATRTFAARPDGESTEGSETHGDSDAALGFLAPPGRADSIGRIGHYEVLEVLGRGAFGIVLRAFDDRLQRVVAVKVLAPSMAVTSPARKRFLREARSSAQVRHDNVVQVHAVEEQPLPYLVMEFIPGETLQQRLDRTGPLELPEILRIGRQIAEGLAAAHATGLIHRDIKPANVLIESTPQERVKITDFGLARAADDASISQSGIVAGTPMYMAPEQAKGESLDHRADLFSLGSALYVMCTGRPPFRASGTMAVLKRVCEEQPRPIREIIPEVPEWLCRIVEKLHAKDPAERFQSAREVADLLGDCEAQFKTHGSMKDFGRIPGGNPTQHSRRRKRVAAAALAILACGAIVALASTLPWWHRTARLDERTVVVNVEQLDGKDVRLRLAGKEFVFRSVGEHRILVPAGRHYAEWVSPGKPVIGQDVVVAKNGETKLTVSAWPTSSDAEGWVQLFNGKDLTGWKPFESQPKTWQVINGILVGSYGPGHLYTVRDDFQNFHLRAEVAINEGADADIYFRSKMQPPNLPGKPRSPAGYVVDLEEGKDRYTGPVSFHNPANSTWTTQGANSVVKPDEWFTLDVIADGNHLVTKVNGVTAVDFVEEVNAFRTGRMALQVWKADTVLKVRKLEIKVLPPSSPEVPQRAADVLPFLAGNWKTETLPTDAKLPPDSAHDASYTTFDFVAGGKFLRQRGMRHAIFAYDAEKGILRQWAAASAAPSGLTWGPAIGLFNPTNRTVTWTVRWGDGNEATHQSDTVDANTIDIRVFLRDGKDNIAQNLPVRLTRVNGPVTLPDWPLDPKRPEEMKVLDRLVGEWHDDLTVKEAAAPDKPKAQTARGKSELILGGRFVETTTTYEPGNQSDYSLAWFDPATKQYRQWLFNGAGYDVEFTGTWNEAAKALTWNTLDGKQEGRWVFKGDDLREFRHLTKDGVGKVLSEAITVSRRITAAPPLAVAPFDAAKAKELQEEWAKHLGVPVEQTNSIGMKFRLILPGEFTMGSPENEPDRGASETQHNVTITRPFCLGAHPVTVGQFRAFVKDSGYQTVAGKDGGVWTVSRDGWKYDPKASWQTPGFEQTDDCPVVGVNWNDAKAFCDWLSQKEGKQYALPTEAEWEYACRAGSQTAFGFGDNKNQLREYAWVAGISNWQLGNADWRTRPVGKKKPNAWGLFDMHGNVRNMTADWYSDDYYSSSAKTDPTGPARGTDRAVRGGNWYSWPDQCRSAYRQGNDPATRYATEGFRVAIVGDLKPKPPLAVAPFDAAKAKEHQEAWAKHLGVPVETTNSIGMKLRLIPPGEFTMGSPEDEPDRVANEGPQHKVTIAQPFLIGAHHVTVGQFREFVKSKNYKTDAENSPLGGSGLQNGKWINDRRTNWQNPGFGLSDDYPVTCVSWNDAQAFCDWLSEKEDKRYALPAEAQWEYACRAGSPAKFHFGDDDGQLDDYAWYTANSDGRAHAVGKKKPNAWDLYDMQGNAWQWTADSYTADAYQTNPGGAARTPKSGDQRTARGGSWFDAARLTRSAYRGHFPQSWTETHVGFRVAIVGDLKPKPPAPQRTAAPFDAAEAKKHQEAWAKQLGVQVETTNSIGMKLRLVPPGEFTMGSSKEEIDWLLQNVHEFKQGPDWQQDVVRSEGPSRRVTIREPFYLGTYEVTVGYFREFVRATKYKTEAEKNGGGQVWSNEKGTWEQKPEYVWDTPGLSRSDSHPVFQVALADARAFCEWLSKKEGRRYVIPTEEQWEYACRAGTTTRWFFGDVAEQTKKYGWTMPHSDGPPRPVGRLAPNPFGLYDVCGNASEMTVDSQGRMVERGGMAGESEWRARSAYRHVREAPWDGPNSARGFRVAIVGDLESKAPAPPVAKKPEPPAVAPVPHPTATLLRKFDPVKDETITSGAQDKTGWLFPIKTPREERLVRLYEIANPQVDAGGVLVFRVRMSTIATRAYPEIVCRFPDGTETRSMAPKVVAEGSTNVVTYEVRCPQKSGAKADMIRLNLVLKGEDGGNAYFRETELWHLPAEQLHGRLASPTTLPRKFNPATDESISFASPQDATGWYFAVKPGQQTVRLHEVENPKLDEAATLVLRGRFGTLSVKGAFLQIACCFPDGTQTVSKEPEVIAEGDTNPTTYEIRFPLKKGEKPYLIRLNIVLKKNDKDQSVFLKDVELSQAPAVEPNK